MTDLYYQRLAYMKELRELILSFSPTQPNSTIVIVAEAKLLQILNSINVEEELRGPVIAVSNIPFSTCIGSANTDYSF